jgi:hypothetical protein
LNNSGRFLGHQQAFNCMNATKDAAKGVPGANRVIWRVSVKACRDSR